MFERYNINDLFLASINVTYPANDMWDVNIGDIFMSGTAGYGYLTVLRKVGEKYIDLQDISKKITTTIDPTITSYTVDYMEPLSKYYTQDGKKKEIFSKRQAIKTGRQYYNDVHQNHLNQIKEEQEKTKSL